ncbi:hypothetical protein [Acinetobacter courvalinii]|uniref:hypothetical protein n=1 Tax=Acinetobacter courvalinii TaxID=280147 RepID=UPI001D0E02F4|nr:hypothetical protein [Acinetobacter courvalinii]
MKKILLLAMLLGLTGCGDNNQGDTTQTNIQVSTLQKAEATPAVANYILAASPRTMGAVAPLAGWNVTKSTVVGASTLIDAIKDTKVSAALVSPNAKQVAEVLRGGAAGIALSIAVDQLLGAVDWVMDPANNQIKFKVKPCLDCDPQVIPGIGFIPTEYVGYNGGDTSIIFTSAMEICSYSLKFLPIGKGLIGIQKAYAIDSLARPIPTQVGYRVGCDFTSSVFPNGASTHVGYVVADNEEKTLSLEGVAKQVISNADAGSLDAQVATKIAAQNILNDVSQAEPVVQELENNANDRCAAHNSYQNGKASLIEGRYNEMYVDVHNLYRDYRALRPTHPDGWGTWQGHINKYKEEQTLLNAIIVDAILDGCPETVKANRWKKKENPPKPSVHSQG